MPQHLIILFVVVPMAAGIVSLLLHGKRRLQSLTGLVFLAVNIAVACWALATVYVGEGKPTGVLVSQMGNWPAPFGITIAIDGLSAVMLAVSSIVCFCVYLYCITTLPGRINSGFFHPLFHLLIFGVQWSFATGDLFNLFVAFEIMLMASYSMFVVGASKAQARQAYKYVLLNLIGSTLFVTTAGLLYGQLGTLNMADITRLAMSNQLPSTSIPVITMLLIVFGGKTAIFPLWYWLPETYPTMPAAIGGLFAGLLTKVGAYVMIRVFVMMFGQSQAVVDIVQPIILLSAGVTMFVGVLGAVSMHSVRQILSIHIISQVGYMMMGVGMATKLAVAGAIFFIIHNMVVKCCLFLCAGLIEKHAGSDDLNKIGGLLKRAPWLATLFLIAALSLAGLPPLSGFFGKLILIREAFETGHMVLVTFAVITSLFTLLSMLKIWSYGFWSPASGAHERHPNYRPRTGGGIAAVAILVVLALGMGFGAASFMKVAEAAAASVVDPKAYVEAVLGQQVWSRAEAARLAPVEAPHE